MTDSSKRPNGGVRPGAGRPPGARNKASSRADQYEARLFALVDPQFEATVVELIRLALYATRESDRLKAIGMLHDRLIGKTADVVEFVGAEAPLTADALVQAWREANKK